MFWRTRPTPSETIVEWERKGARQAQPQAAELGRESIGRDSTLRFSKNTRNAAPNWRARPPNVKAQTRRRTATPGNRSNRRWTSANLGKTHRDGVTVIARQRRIREAVPEAHGLGQVQRRQAAPDLDGTGRTLVSSSLKRVKAPAFVISRTSLVNT